LTDFLTVEECTIRGLVTHYVLFFMDIANRAVKIAGITPHPDSRWMTQIARSLTDLNDGFLRGKHYLILDRDTKYSDAFRSVLVREGIQVIRLPPRSPNLKAFAERFVRSIKEECLSRMIFSGPASLQHAVRQFMAHYHSKRNHQGLDNRLPRPECRWIFWAIRPSSGSVQVRPGICRRWPSLERQSAALCQNRFGTIASKAAQIDPFAAI
jgi:putative transposase